MSLGSIQLTDKTSQYLAESQPAEPEILQALSKETQKLSGGGMQTGYEQVCFMQNLLRLINAKHVIEVGTFTGYGSLAMALALPEDGKVITLDIDEKPQAHGKKAWKQAGVENKIEPKIGDALVSLKNMKDTNQFDAAYIDADKERYEAYFDECLRLVRKGGLIMVDNLLWGGEVADPSTNKTTRALQDFNQQRKSDTRVYWSLTPIGDGLGIAYVR